MFGDQSIGIWLNEIIGVQPFSDNKRLLSVGTNLIRMLRKEKGICQNIIGLHHAYPDDMRLFWNLFLYEQQYIKMDVPPIRFKCKFRYGIDIKTYTTIKKSWPLPRPCKDKPIFGNGRSFKSSQNYREKRRNKTLESII